MLYENYEKVVENVKNACARSGRNFDDVTIIAVSKTKPLSDVEELLAHGVTEFGENKVQEMVDKYEHVSKPVHWHLIGHLQTNKVKYIIDKVDMIQSVDSIRLAREIDRQAKKHGRVMDVLLEVNIGAEESKSGFLPECLEEALPEISGFKNIHVRGLMAIPPKTPPEAQNDYYFLRMRQLFVDIQSKKIDNINMDFLSMGMSQDFESAILSGANMVRIGTSLFGGRK